MPRVAERALLGCCLGVGSPDVGVLLVGDGLQVLDVFRQFPLAGIKNLSAPCGEVPIEGVVDRLSLVVVLIRVEVPVQAVLPEVFCCLALVDPGEPPVLEPDEAHWVGVVVGEQPVERMVLLDGEQVVVADLLGVELLVGVGVFGTGEADLGADRAGFESDRLAIGEEGVGSVHAGHLRDVVGRNIDVGEIGSVRWGLLDDPLAVGAAVDGGSV